MATSSDDGHMLHWVMKVGNLKESVTFFSRVFGMRVLRHEEFSSGCAATCNGPYGGAWSKTMVGFGPESKYFALELTYNYGVESYEAGNDLRHIVIKCTTKTEPFLPLRKALILETASELGYAVSNEGDFACVTGPDEYRYLLAPHDDPRIEDPVLAVSLNVSILRQSLGYWKELLGLQVLSDDDAVATAIPKVDDSQSRVLLRWGARTTCCLELVEIPGDETITHGERFGRIAFSSISGPETVFKQVAEAPLGGVINSPIRLETPGKADVVVTILADPDGYEICFVNEDGFHDLCRTKPLDDYIDWQGRAVKGGDGHPPPVLLTKEDMAEHFVESISTEEELQAAVNGHSLLLVDFMASWCGKCKLLLPVVHELATSFSPSGLKVVTVDVDEAEELAEAAGVAGVPHFVLYRAGTVLDSYVGSDPAALQALIRDKAK